MGASRRVARALAGGLRRGADLFPLTPLGVILGGCAAAGLTWIAYAELDLVLLVIGYGALGLIGLAVAFVALAALVVKRRASVRHGAYAECEPLVFETGRPKPTGFVLPAMRWLPLVQLDWSWLRPRPSAVRPAVDRGALREEATLFDRGELVGIGRRLVVQDAFGLARLAVRARDDRTLEVWPSAGALRRLPLLTSFAGGDEYPHPMGLDQGDRLELRRYVSGDPARFIHWKIFGRTGKLMVRVPERALSRARRIVAYLVAGPEDDASAAAARVAVESGALGPEWLFSADGAGGAEAKRASEALHMIVRSSAARAQGGVELAEFVERAERSGPVTTVVFAPPRPGAWLDHVCSVARRRAGRVRVVIGVDGLGADSRPSWWRRLLTVPRDDLQVTSAEALETVLRTLGAARCETVVLDRRSGRQLGEVHRAAIRSRGEVSSRRPPHGARSSKAGGPADARRAA